LEDAVFRRLCRAKRGGGFWRPETLGTVPLAVGVSGNCHALPDLITHRRDLAFKP